MREREQLFTDYLAELKKVSKHKEEQKSSKNKEDMVNHINKEPLSNRHRMAVLKVCSVRPFFIQNAPDKVHNYMPRV